MRIDKRIPIDRVTVNNHRRSFVVSAAGETWEFPFARLDVAITAADPIKRIYIDPELALEGFTIELESGLEDAVLLDQVLDYNEDPGYMRDLLLYNLTIAAQDALAESRLSKRAIARRLKTSPAQVHRLLDQTNYTKSIDSMLDILHALGREIDVNVRQRRAGACAETRGDYSI